jgi:hypothetical protein
MFDTIFMIMTKPQKIILISSGILFVLIGFFGLRYVGGKSNAGVSLFLNILILVEIVLLIITYILYNDTRYQFFSFIKSHGARIGIGIGIFLGIFLIWINIPNLSFLITKGVITVNKNDPNFVAPSSFVVSQLYQTGKNAQGNNVIQVGIQNKTRYTIKDVVIKFEFFKMDGTTLVLTHYERLPLLISAGSNTVQNVVFYIPFQNGEQFKWKVTPLGATKV